MKHKFLAMILVLAMLLSFTACGQSSSTSAVPSESQAVSDTQQAQTAPTIVFVSKGPDDFWAYVEAGVVAAAQEYGINT